MQKPHSTIGSRMLSLSQDWLDKVKEAIVEPELEIIDPHHHLWDFPEHTYLLKDFLKDTGAGHKVHSTVFMECTACYRADGPEHMYVVLVDNGRTRLVGGALQTMLRCIRCGTCMNH